MNQQNPYMMPGFNPGPGPSMPNMPMPNWSGNPNNCHCSEELKRLDSRINRLERQMRRVENRLSRLEGGLPVPLMANDQNDTNGYSNMYML